MAEVKWNQFRSLHKGLDKEEISILWTKYKDGDYEVPSSEEQPTEETVEEPVEEPTLNDDEETEVDPLEVYAELFNQVFNNPALTDEELHESRVKLAQAAKETGVKGYKCDPTDGWKLWLGPTKAAVLCNETKDVAFACNRGWWHTFYHGASLCYVETCSEAETVHRMADYFRKRDRFVERVPIPSLEIMLPASKLEIINKASGSWSP